MANRSSLIGPPRAGVDDGPVLDLERDRLAGVPAGHPATSGVGHELRVLGPATRGGERTAGGVRAARGQVRGVDRAAGDDGQRLVEVGVHVGYGGHERPRVGMPRPRGQLGGGQVLHDPAGVHHEHAVADLSDHGDVVADQHQRDVVGLPDRTEQVEHLLLHGDVEGGGGLVGHDQRGRPHQTHADHGPLAHPAGELVGVLVRAPLGVGDPHRPQPVDGTGQGRLAAETVVVARHLGELATDAAGRVERGHRVLEHHRQRGAEQAPLHLRVPDPQVGAEQLEPGRIDAARVGDETRDRQGGQ